MNTSEDNEPKSNSEEEREDTLEIDESADSEEAKDESFDKLVRLTADFENYKKRNQKERADLLRYGNENLVSELLPILDNFERAVEHAKSAKEIDSIRTGVEMIFNQLVHTLDRFGVKAKTSVGQEFDPMVHEAVSHVESDDHKPNTVVSEHQKAYFLHDRLVRPAMVEVAKEGTGSTEKAQETKPKGNVVEISQEEMDEFEESYAKLAEDPEDGQNESS